MQSLHEVLAARSDEVIVRWKAMVEETMVPTGTSTGELVDHLPIFVQEVIQALKADAGADAIPPSADDGKTAAEHGEQRLRLGFSLDSVAREYGALRDAMVATGAVRGHNDHVRRIRSSCARDDDRNRKRRHRILTTA